MNLPKHGANPHYLYQKMERPMPEEIIDFSVNLNPWGPPPAIFAQWQNWQEEIIAYPDPNGQQLKEKIASREQIQPTNILLGNGAAELIQLLAAHFRDQKIGIFQPTFSEYERMTKNYGADITHLSLAHLADSQYINQVTQEQAAIFLCHPNNPTGEMYAPSVLENLRAACERNQCYLIVDEAFYDFAPDPFSMVPALAKSSYLIILRSVTKMYSIAGIRLGVLFAAPTMVESLRAYQSYWSVNALALKIGECVLEEEAFVQATQEKIAAIRNEVLPLLADRGYLLSKSQVNFFLLRDPTLNNQKELLLFLLEKGLVPRHSENYPGLDGQWLRFAIRPLAEMKQLVEALDEWKEK